MSTKEILQAELDILNAQRKLQDLKICEQIVNKQNQIFNLEESKTE